MSNKFSPYNEYKSTNISWLPKIPSHWKLLPGKACFSEKKTTNKGMLESKVLSLSYGQLVVKPEDKLHGLVPESFETYQIVEPGDIIFRTTDLQNDWNSLRFGISRHRGIITSAYMCLRATSTLIDEYAHQLLHTYDLMKIFYGLGSGLRQNIDWRDMKYLPVLAPPLEEQNAIVRFLDYTDRRIKHNIRAKQKLIKLLEEEKQAIIHQAVTRGLNPDAPMKHSGVDWLGVIPEHWEIRRLKFLAEIKTGGSDTINRKDNGKFPFFVRSQKVEKIDTYSYEGEAVLTAGDGAGVAKVFHYYDGKFDFHQRVYRFSKFRNIHGKFFYYFFSNTLKFEAFRQTAKSTVDSLRLPLLQNFPIPIFPMSEQNLIVEELEKIKQGYENKSSFLLSEISLLKEYRTRLITNVVTGKLDVREAAAQLPEELEEDVEIEEPEVDDEEELQEEIDP